MADEHEESKDQTIRIGLMEDSEQMEAIGLALSRSGQRMAYLEGCLEGYVLALRITAFVAALFFGLWYLENGTE